MAIQYTIAADIIDIREDNPCENDCFLLDTNVLYWMTYTKASINAKSYQMDDYPSYVNSVLDSGGKTFFCGLSLAELIHLIEKTEWEIFSKKYKTQNIKLKEFRHNYSVERKKVITEIDAAWSQVKSIAEFIDLTIDSSLIDFSINRLKTQKVDGYDFFILEFMREKNIENIITDDGDFSTIPGIKVFTANINVIETARKQNKILRRMH